MPACDRVGFFRAEMIEYGLQKATDAQSQSVGITFRALLTEMWDGEKWVDWRAYEMDAYGTSWIVKKDGTVNDRAVESLCKHCGWDGVLGSVVDFTWKATPFQCEIKEDTYKNETRYRIEWINAFDSIPGGGAMGNVDSDKLKELEARFGASLRAVTANVKRNQPASSGGRPAAPPKPPAPAMAGGDGGRVF